ncbi:MAG: O-antigen ligase [Maribacter sp.]|jgi:O-antigen ligase
MRNSNTIEINLSQLLFTLFCGYAFSMPFELLLEYTLDIGTILKPFRIFSILIIAVFIIRALKNRRLDINQHEKADLLLYGVFVYGMIISLFRMITGIFNMGIFYNDVFQVGLHVATFFVFKNTLFSKKQALKIFNFFIVGITINAIYLIYLFMRNMQWGRQSGFTDNPNYVAFGIVAVFTFLALKTNLIKQQQQIIAYTGLAAFLILAFTVTGSRTGFIMLLVAGFFVFFLSNFRRKIMLSLGGLFIILILLPQQLGKLPTRGPTILLERINRSLGEEEEDVRFVIWRGVFRVLEDKSYFGIGVGQFKANFPKYYSKESNKLILEIVNRNYYLSPHSDYLAILVDYGAPSFFLYLAFLSVSLWKLFLRVTYPSEDEDEQLINQFSFIFLICIMIFGLTAENFLHQLYWFLLMFTTKKYI